MQDEDLPGGGPAHIMQFSQLLLAVIAALKNGNTQAAIAQAEKFLSNRQGGVSILNYPDRNTPAAGTALPATHGNHQFLFADSSALYAEALVLADRANLDGLVKNLCSFFSWFFGPDHQNQICESLGQNGAIEAIEQLCKVDERRKQHILDTALIGALASGNDNYIFELIKIGANRKIFDLSIWNAQTRLSLREAIVKAKEALEQNLPALSVVWLRRYFDGCMQQGGNAFQTISDDINDVVARDDDTIKLLIVAVTMAVNRNNTKLIGHLCQIVAIVVESHIDLEDLWIFIVNNGRYDAISLIRSLVRDPVEKDYVIDICLVHAVRLRKISVVKQLCSHGASTAITVLGRRQLYGDQIDTDVHMPLIDICMDDDLVETNDDIALILMANGAPSVLEGGAVIIDCMSIYLDAGAWKKVAGLCSLGVSCTGYLQILANNPQLDANAPNMEQAALVLNGLGEALVIIYRLPPNLAFLVFQCVAETMNRTVLSTSLLTLRSRPAYAELSGLIDDLRALLSGDYNSLRPQVTGGLSTTPTIEFTQSFFILFIAACQSQYPPTLTELLAWIRLYEMNNTEVMSHDELFGLIIQRCLPHLIQGPDENMDDDESMDDENMDDNIDG